MLHVLHPYGLEHYAYFAVAVIGLTNLLFGGLHWAYSTLVRSDTSAAIPYYGVGVFVPISIMGLAMREHVKQHATGKMRAWGLFGTTFATVLSTIIFVGQIVTKWNEGGWVVFNCLLTAYPVCQPDFALASGLPRPEDIHHVIRKKSRIHGAMGNIIEW